MTINIHTGKEAIGKEDHVVICTPAKTVVITSKKNLIPAQVKIYEAFFTLVGEKYFTQIQNAPFHMDIDRVVSVQVAIQKTTIDFNTLSAADKLKITDLTQLLPA